MSRLGALRSSSRSSSRWPRSPGGSRDPPRRQWQALAVLPFETLGAGDAALDPLGIGLADGIITRLSGQRVLLVRSTSAVRAYAGVAQRDVRSIGRTLDADVVLEGHIRRGGDTVRVTVQLTEIEAGAPGLGSDIRSAFIRALQARGRDCRTGRGRAATAVGRRRTGTICDGGIRPIAPPTRRICRAARRCLATREAARKRPCRTSSAPSRSTRRYVLARAGLAMASADMYLRDATESESEGWGERAEREAAEALALDPDLAEAHVARAAVLRKREFDWTGTIETSRRAITLNPDSRSAAFVRRRGLLPPRADGPVSDRARARTRRPRL